MSDRRQRVFPANPSQKIVHQVDNSTIERKENNLYVLKSNSRSSESKLEDNLEYQVIEFQNHNVTIEQNLGTVSPALLEDKDDEIENFLKESETQQKGIVVVPQEKKKESQIYLAQWSNSQFLECFLYHIVLIFINLWKIFYMFLGPFCNLLFFRNPGMKMMRNFKFYGVHTQTFLQSTIWLFSISTTIIFFFIPSTNALSEEQSLVWVLLALRMVVISSKYATFPKQKWLDYKTRLISDQEFDEELILRQWSAQPPFLVFQEIDIALKSNQYNPSQFWIQFITPPNEQNIAKIGENAKLMDQYFDKTFIKERTEQWLEKQKIQPGEHCGYLVYLLVVKGYESYSKNRNFLYATSIGLITAFTPLLYQGIFGNLNEDTTFDIIRQVLNICLIIFGCSTSFVFLFVGLRDFQRRLYLLRQCALLFTMKKQQSSEEVKLLPTLNFAKPEQINAWIIMCSVSREYGERFYLRVQGFYTILFGLCFIVFVLVLLYILNLFVAEKIISQIIIAEQAIVYYGLLIVFLIRGAQLNQTFTMLQNILEELKYFFIDIKSQKEKYFIDNSKPNDLMVRKVVQEIKKYKPENQGIGKYLDSLVESIDQNIGKLKYQERNYSIRLYGVPITNILLKSAVVGLGTIIGFAFQQRYQTDILLSKINK